MATPAAVKSKATAFSLLACPWEGFPNWFPTSSIRLVELPSSICRDPKEKRSPVRQGKWGTREYGLQFWLIQSLNVELPPRALPQVGGALGL